MIEELTRTLWGVRRAATDGVPTEQRLEAARTTMSDTETMTDRANREAIAAGEAAIDRLTALYNAAEAWDFEPDAADGETPAERFQEFDDAEGASILDEVWDFEPDRADGETSAERFQSFDDAEGAQILDEVLRPCASVSDDAAAAITLLIAALTAMQGRR